MTEDDGSVPVVDGDDDASEPVIDRGRYDVLGVGLGPFNLGLAALLDGADPDCDLEAVFLEREPEFAWHEGMLIEGATLEVPFLADLVTMADPTNPYSFLNYVRERDRIYEFYFYETFQIPRREYDDYLRWVAETVPTTQFGREVTSVEYEAADADSGRDGADETADAGTFVVEAVAPETGQRYRYRADDLVMGVGSRPALPEFARDHADGDAPLFHTADYLDRRADVLEADSITVVGSGQSAAEVVLDLLERQSGRGFRLDWLTRSDGFFPMEYSKLGLQHFTPEYTEYFYDLPQSRKDELLPDQDLLYKGIDPETSERIYDTLYERSIGDRDPDFGMLATTAVRDIERLEGSYWLECEHRQQDHRFALETDAVIFGTGYQRPTPTFLEPIADRIAFDDRGRFQVSEDYRLEGDLGGADDAGGRVFVQNAEMHTHGVGTPDLGLGCYRNAVIIERLADREVYSIDRDTVFQDFDVERFADHAPVRTDAPRSLAPDTE
ncbi:lysine N(6)-hydroxylase/L-ornithine N(5)-oxygenase family protein [Haloterrigena sp. SYSU A121-1]|uniref:Lysine N(6)-hydroxylase/L-ornithine N(5)-oxygenase family protein n=1 Tax=Haloterrigena gelatinilytica TaxID=2741724 RepID=A0A8J8GL18_9EURY|nr:lysine N(6)-hydroxylase/L-ornithine N(5)-oxygenase family protein [Haloterrigena gelatinilytica]NUB90339.1 lysine N(6)-hydroxylase/L-ornithine N(5)-oxygenase family protein [Haloterrigena gelatinilytica]